MEFVTGRTDKMNAGIPEVEPVMADSLYTIRMEDGIELLTEFAYRMDIQQVPDFIIGMHQAYQSTLLTAFQQATEISHVNMTQFIQLHKGKLHVTAAAVMLHRM